MINENKLRTGYASSKSEKEEITLSRELILAKQIQAQLLNGKRPNVSGCDLLGSTIPARLIGGDYYDFCLLPNGKVRLVIGDVMGKGIPAAMLMILTRGAFRAVAETVHSPGETLTYINHALYTDLRSLHSFVTLFCADWDPITRILSYSSAGHHMPLHIQPAQNKAKELPKVSGMMIGGLPNQTYQEGSITLMEDETIFLYTDGIVEAVNRIGEQFKLKRLTKALLEVKEKNCQEISSHVLKVLENFTDGIVQHDDITMVMLKMTSFE